MVKLPAEINKNTMLTEDNLSVEYLNDLKLEFYDESSTNESKVKEKCKFECQECGKCFKVNNDLNVHQRVVQECSKCFGRKS